MHSTFLFIASLLLSLPVLQATATEFPLFTQVSKSEFGRTLLNLASLHSKLGHPIDDIAALLTQIHDSLTEAQTDMDTQRGLDQQTCQTNLDSLQNSIETNQNLLQTSQDEVKRLEGVIKDKTDERDATQRQKDNDESTLRGKEEENAKALERYGLDNSDLESAIQACVEALDLLGKLNTGSSFIQLSGQISNRLDRVREKLNKHLPSGMVIYTPIIEALSQLKNKADPKAVNDIKELIVKLKEELESHLKTLNENEKNRKENFENEKKHLVEAIDNAADKIARLNKEIQEAEAQKAVEEQNVKTYSDLVEKFKTQKENEEKRCHDLEEAYKKETEERSNELRILEQLIKLFKEKIENFNDYLRQSSDSA